MGKNSVFDDAGIGASDLGLAKDPDKVAQDNQNEINRAKDAAAVVKKEADTAAADKEDDDRKRAGSKSNTILTSAKGLSTDDDGVTRRTLLGS